MGPSNVHCIPFEHGPTAELMSWLLAKLNVPLGQVCLTNAIKDDRGSNRPLSKADMLLFEQELINIRPMCLVLMGAEAKKLAPVAKSQGIESHGVHHLGYLHRKDSVSNRISYLQTWREFWSEKQQDSNIVVKI